MALPVIEIEKSKNSIEVPFPPYDVGFKDTRTYRTYSFEFPRVIPEATLSPTWKVKVEKPLVDPVQEGFENIKTILINDTFYSSSGRQSVYDIPWQSKKVFGLFGYMSDSSIKKTLGFSEEQEMDLKQVKVIIPKGVSEFTAEDKAKIVIEYTIDGEKCHSVIKLFQTYIHGEDEVGGLATNVFPEVFSRENEMKRDLSTVNGLLCWDVEISTAIEAKAISSQPSIRARLKSMGMKV